MNEDQIKTLACVVLFGAMTSQQIQEKSAMFRTLTGYEPEIRIRGYWAGNAVLADQNGVHKRGPVNLGDPGKFWPVIQVARMFIGVELTDGTIEHVIPERGTEVSIMIGPKV